MSSKATKATKTSKSTTSVTPVVPTVTKDVKTEQNVEIKEAKKSKAPKAQKLETKVEVQTETKTETKPEIKTEAKSKVSKSKTSKKETEVSTEKVAEKVVEKVTEKMEASYNSSGEDQTQNTILTSGPTELKFTTQFSALQEEVRTITKTLHGISSNLRKLESAYNSDIKKIRKTRPKRNVPHKATGFAKPKPVPEKLAKFIGVDPGTELTGPQVTKKVWSQLKEKGLTYEKDMRVFRTNAEVSKLFNVPKSVNESTYHKDKAGFNFCNLQKFIANASK